MELNFDRGDKYNPKGHALLYFTNNNNETWATYLMTMPILVDLSKYVPPFLSAQIGNVESTDMSAFAFPPSPEIIPDLEQLYHLAEIRDDDVIYGGVINTADITNLLFKVNEIIQIYSTECKKITNHLNVSNQNNYQIVENDSEPEEVYQDVVYSLMSEGDRLTELSKFVGKLRYAVEGNDLRVVEEAEKEIILLSNHLPENNQVYQLVAAAKILGDKGSQLADLYIQRCYALSKGLYESLSELELRIKEFEDNQTSK